MLTTATAARLKSIARSGRVPLASLERVLAKISDPHMSNDAVEAVLDTLEALGPVGRNGRAVVEIQPAAGGPVVHLDFEARYTIPGLGQRLNPHEVETMRTLMGSVMHLPASERTEALNRAILNHYDGASVAGLGF